MNSPLSGILEEIRELEKKVQSEMKRREEELRYRVIEGEVIFEKDIKAFHKKFARSLSSYIAKAPILTILSAPVIYSMIVPIRLRYRLPGNRV